MKSPAGHAATHMETRIMPTSPARLLVFTLVLASATTTFAQGTKRDALPDMLIAIPGLADGRPSAPFVTESVKRGRVKDIDILFVNKRTTALDANQSPAPHVKVVMSFVQREGCDGGEPFNVTRARAPELVCGVATRGRDDRSATRVPLEIDGTTWTALVPLATDDNVSLCTLRLRIARNVATGAREQRYCFDVTADGVPAADPVIIIRDGGN